MVQEWKLSLLNTFLQNQNSGLFSDFEFQVPSRLQTECFLTVPNLYIIQDSKTISKWTAYNILYDVRNFPSFHFSNICFEVEEMSHKVHIQYFQNVINRRLFLNKGNSGKSAHLTMMVFLEYFFGFCEKKKFIAQVI